MLIGHSADGVRSDAAQGAGAIVSEAQGGSADSGGEDLASYKPGAGKETCAEEPGRGAKDQDEPLCPGRRVKRNEQSGAQGKKYERAPASQPVGNPSETEIAGKHADEIQSHQQGRGVHHAKAASAFFDR